MAVQSKSLQIDERQRDGVSVFALTGKLSEKECGAFVGRLTQAIEAGAKKLVVDVSGLEYLSSAGLGAFVILCTEATDSGGRLILAGENAHVTRLVQLTRLDAVVEIAPSVDEAISRL